MRLSFASLRQRVGRAVGQTIEDLRGKVVLIAGASTGIGVKGGQYVRGGRYGWPYCYGTGSASPEYSTVDCSRFRSPLAPHAAPLGKTWYFGTVLPSQYEGALPWLSEDRPSGRRLSSQRARIAAKRTGRADFQLGCIGRQADGRAYRHQGGRGRGRLPDRGQERDGTAA